MPQCITGGGGFSGPANGMCTMDADGKQSVPSDCRVQSECYVHGEQHVHGCLPYSAYSLCAYVALTHLPCARRSPLAHAVKTTCSVWAVYDLLVVVQLLLLLLFIRPSFGSAMFVSFRRSLTSSV